MSTTFESRPADWLSFAEAVNRILEHSEPLAPVHVSLDEALGRALADDIVASATLPPWDDSAMDGYAVHGEDIRGATLEAPVRLPVVGSVPAGARLDDPVLPGQAVRIMTGAPVPEGADSVVRVEHTDRERERGWVVVHADGDVGRNVRPAGKDMRPGDRLLSKGERVGSGQVAVLSAVGIQSVRVYRRPRVAILSNGDELVGPDEYDRVRAGEAIPESNAPGVAAAVTEAAGIPILLGIARDSEESVREYLDAALASGADLLVTLGGASMGEGDLIKRVLDTMGFRLDFWRVKLRPGSPLSLGSVPRPDGNRELTVMSLPGNPASAFVTFELFVRPALLAMGGHKAVFRPRISATALERLPGRGDLRHFLRVELQQDLNGGVGARLTGPQGSGLVQSLGKAQGLAIVPENREAVEKGDPVDVVLLTDQVPWTWEPV